MSDHDGDLSDGDISDDAARRRRLATVFDADVGNYEAARPGYPPALFEVLADRCDLGPGTRVLEIGPGPGVATLPLLDLGADVVAVEAGERMAERLRQRTSGRRCEVLHAAFETAELGDRRFDLVVSATAFHWVDPQIGVPKAADHLVDGGWLALWWTVFRDFSDTSSAFDQLVRSIAGRHPSLHRSASVSHALQTERRIAEITDDERFRAVEQIVVPFTVTHTPETLRALFASFSDWSTIPEPERSSALDEVARFVAAQPGQTLERTFTTVLYLAQRRPG